MCESQREGARILPDCARELGGIHERLDALEEKLDAISRAVLGNGRTRGSVVDRLARLEQAAGDQAVHTDRAWKAIAVGVSLLSVVVSVLNALF